MPFKSEKQRRYLWANEPEIARDWTNTYGHRTQGQDGGVMRVPFAEGDISWSSKDDPELHQKMNEAVNQARTEYLQKIQSGEIPMPDDLQLALDRLGNKTRHDMLDQQSDQPEIFSETLQEGIDTSNIKQKQKRSREQQLLDDILNQQSNVGGIKPQFASLRTAGDTAAQDVGTYPYYKEQGIEVPDIDALKNELYKNRSEKGLGALSYDELDDANYIPKWNEYTEDPEYDEEEGEDYSVGEQISPFKQWSRNFWANPGQRVMQGINMALPIGPVWKGITGAALQGGQRMGQGLAHLRGGYQTQGGYNQARDQRRLSRRIRQRTADKTQANIQALNADRQRKFQEETRRLQEQLWQQQAPQVQKNIQTHQITGRGGQGGDRSNTGMNAPGGGHGQSPTGGDVQGTPFRYGGLSSLWK